MTAGLTWAGFGEWFNENLVAILAFCLAAVGFTTGTVIPWRLRRREAGQAQLEPRWEKIKTTNENTAHRLVVTNHGQAAAEKVSISYGMCTPDVVLGDDQLAEWAAPGDGVVYPGQEVHKALGLVRVPKGGWIRIVIEWDDARPDTVKIMRDVTLQYLT